MNIERLKRYMRRMVDFQNCGDCELNTVCEHGGECVFLTVREALAKVPEWVPVTERVPENDDHVLCCTQTKAGKQNVVIGYWMDGMWRCGMNSNVTHWMKLPGPPEADA